MKYTVFYGSSSQQSNATTSNSRNARKLGRVLLGSAGGGRIWVYQNDKCVAAACYTPEMGGKWYSTTPMTGMWF